MHEQPSGTNSTESDAGRAFRSRKREKERKVRRGEGERKGSTETIRHDTSTIQKLVSLTVES